MIANCKFENAASNPRNFVEGGYVDASAEVPNGLLHRDFALPRKGIEQFERAIERLIETARAERPPYLKK